jgi:serine/threonine protein kinase
MVILGSTSDYTGLKKIAEGNYGRIYKAKSVEDGETYALKYISKKIMAATSSSLACLISEIE